MGPGEWALRYSEMAIRSSASLSPWAGCPPLAPVPLKLKRSVTPPQAGKSLTRGLNYVIVHVAAVERMWMAKDRISADPPLLEQSLDSYLPVFNWYPDRFFSHNPLLFGRHWIDYIY